MHAAKKAKVEKVDVPKQASIDRFFTPPRAAASSSDASNVDAMVVDDVVASSVQQLTTADVIEEKTAEAVVDNQQSSQEEYFCCSNMPDDGIIKQKQAMWKKSSREFYFTWFKEFTWLAVHSVSGAMICLPCTGYQSEHYDPRYKDMKFLKGCVYYEKMA